MKTFFGFVAGLFIGGACIVAAMSKDEQYAKGILTIAGYDFKTPSETKKEHEAK